jgi:hypothetical protein
MMMKLRNIVIICVIILASCKVTRNTLETKNCNCKNITKAYIRIEEQIIYDKNYLFLPERSITIYADGTHTNPPINKNVAIIQNCTNIEFGEPTKFLAYFITEETLDEIKIWVSENCPEEYNKLKR